MMDCNDGAMTENLDKPMTEDIDARFCWHTPSDEGKQAIAAMRENFRHMCSMLSAHVPNGREKALALTKLEECMFWTNAAIARQGEVQR